MPPRGNFGPLPLTEFTMDAIRVFRGWDLDRLGRLEAITYRYPWRPGLNEAVCRASERNPELTIEHMAGCACGFYGLFMDEEEGREYARDVARRNPVEGVVDLSGSVVVGTTGARGSRARIVALVTPTPTPWDRLAAALGAWLNGLAAWAGLGLIILGVVAFVMAIVASTVEKDARFLFLLIVAALIGAVFVIADLGPSDVDVKRSQRLRKLYPEVEHFQTRKAMLAKYPVTTPAVSVTPETHDGFWDIKA